MPCVSTLSFTLAEPGLSLVYCSWRLVDPQIKPRRQKLIQQPLHFSDVHHAPDLNEDRQR